MLFPTQNNTDIDHFVMIRLHLKPLWKQSKSEDKIWPIGGKVYTEDLKSLIERFVGSNPTSATKIV